jgi:hypothetical protein
LLEALRAWGSLVVGALILAAGLFVGFKVGHGIGLVQGKIQRIIPWPSPEPTPDPNRWWPEWLPKPPWRDEPIFRQTIEDLEKLEQQQMPEASQPEENQSVAEPACVSCTFYQSHSGSGICHRFPNPLAVSDRHWCGEYTAVLG